MAAMSDDEPSVPANPVLSVSGLNRLVRDCLEAAFPLTWVGGEISNLTLAASGHVYFSLKDAGAQVRCVMWRNRAQLLGWRPENGQQVEVRALVSFYEPRGEFQLNVETIRRAGQGDLFERFLRLKAQLEAEGLFTAEIKRPLPEHPRALAVVTSPQAAALRDVLTTLRRRAPHLRIDLYPTPVQGEGAADRIAAAVQLAAAGGCDAILLCRGGGSIEDLWSFNEEVVARAIRASRLPVVAGIGHETDFTIADFAADLRAPTPTAAAELVSQPRAVWLGALDLLAGRLQDGVQRQIDLRHQRLDQAAQRLGRPSGLVARQQLRLSGLAQRMRHAALLKTQRLAQSGKALQAHLPQIMQRSLVQRRERLERAALRLSLLNPQLVLRRGYALLTDAQGQPVMRPAQVRPGEAVHARLAEGELDLTVAQRRLL